MPLMSPIFLHPSRGRRRRPWKTCSSHSLAGDSTMSERVPFPITEEMARAELQPLPRRSFRHSSMVQLTLVRFREFIREPEAVFWTYIFPILLAAGLGIAFRQRPPDKAHV